jgi:hypothetical protein
MTDARAVHVPRSVPHVILHDRHEGWRSDRVLS